MRRFWAAEELVSFSIFIVVRGNYVNVKPCNCLLKIDQRGCVRAERSATVEIDFTFLPAHF